jgi:hypothetical protein
MQIINLRQLAEENDLELVDQAAIGEEAGNFIAAKYNFKKDMIKANFDSLLEETGNKAYELYLKYEADYGKKVLEIFVNQLIKNKEIKNISNVGEILGKNFKLLDSFFLSIAQSRKSRAGAGFESMHNTLFKALDYPFDEQVVINGKPDFLMPSEKHYLKNPMDCIIFTAKRTLRERWRQIVTEGTRGLGFYLATIDTNVSDNQLKEMLKHRIYLVVPESIKKAHYSGKVNVLNFGEFFEDHLDPKVKVWKKQGII